MDRKTSADAPARPFNVFQSSNPAIHHVAVLSAIALPFAFIPYIVAKRHINGLRKTAELLEKNITRLRADMDATMTRQMLTSIQLARLRDLDLRSKTVNYWRDQRRLTANGVLQDDLGDLKRASKDLRMEQARG